MNKTFIIITREYISRVKQKTFLISTFLAPILMVGFYALLIYVLLKEDSTQRTIAVYNQSDLVVPLKSDSKTTFEYLDSEPSDNKELLQSKGYYAILYIPSNLKTSNQISLYSNKQIPSEVSTGIGNKIESILEKQQLDALIKKINLPDLENQIAATKTRIEVTSIKISEEGEKKSSSLISTILSFMAMGVGFLIFFLVMNYGSIVMRGVAEEKSSRIVEVIISSVKPFQLMIGKIVGIALVGITQILIWGIIGIIVYAVSIPILLSNVDPESISSMTDASMQATQASGFDSQKIPQLLNELDFGMLTSLAALGLLYAILGYFLYACLFAAVGSAVDSETETQQLSMPIMIPLMLAFYIAFNVARNPESPLAFWASIIPFTSPIVMPARIPFDVPSWELFVSIGLLLLSIVGFIWLSAKIYRTGILMYGKKADFKEIWKWIRY